jgi:cytoskeleton protein RodZ
VGAFGDKFRKAREAKNFSLDDVSDVTKISARMLQAIEEEHFDQLPGGVFNKGFIRAYAKHLGLNDEEAITDYLACLRQAQIDAHEVWEPVPPATAAPKHPQEKPARQKPTLKPQTPVHEDELPGMQLPRAEDLRPPRPNYAKPGERGIPWSIVAVAAVVIVLGAILWVRHSRSTRIEAAHAASTNPATVIPPALPSAHASTSPSSETQPTAHASPLRSQVGNASTPPPPAAATHPAAPAETKTAAISQSSPQVNQPTSHEETEEKDVTVRTLVPPSQAPPTQVLPVAPPAKAATRMTLVIRASETSWISVTADGQPVTHETLIAPAETSFRATHEIVARIGNAGGVSFLFNGKEIPTQGGAAEVKTFVFDANGVREIPNQPPVQNR